MTVLVCHVMFLPSYKAMLDLGKQKMATPDERRARLLRAIEAGEEAVMGNGEGQRRMEDETEAGPGGGWWDHLLGNFFGGDEDAMFTDLRMNKRVFRLVVSAVDDIALARRGRRAFVFSHEERIIFLHVYLAFGIDVITMLLTPRIRTVCEIHRIAKSTCEMYAARLRGLFVVGRNEWRRDTNNVGYVIDCTVVQVKRPGVGFEEAKLWFSGKHHIYCVKKEVVVNSRTGTAAFVSTGRPGSVHDVTVMRSDSAAINQLVGRSTLLGDKGYRGGESSVPMLFVVEDETRRELRVQRTLVECFFGRLKNKYKAFGRKWFLGVDMFDGFFDCACALTNADILVNPLSVDDQRHNQNILNSWQAEEADRRESRRRRNEAYRRRVEAERSALGEELFPDDETQSLGSFLGPQFDN